MHRMHSLPPWETLTEPGDSEDAEDEADEDDELASVSGSHISHSPAASSGNTGIRSAASTLPNLRGVNANGRLSRQFGLGTRAPFATPPNTQPAQISGSTLGGYDTMGRKKELLGKLITQGRRQSEQSLGGTSSRASGSGISSPSREDDAMPPPPNPSPSQTQSQDTLRTGKERAAGFSATQPVASSTRSVSMAYLDKNTSQRVIPQSYTQDSLINPPIRNNTSARTLGQTQFSSSAGRPSTSQSQHRLRITNALSAPEVTQASKGSDNSSSDKRKEKDIIEVVESDDDMDAPRSQILTRPKPRKKAADEVNKSPVISSSSLRRSSPLCSLSTSSGDELPASLSQIASSPGKDQSQRKSAASSPSVRHRAREEVLEEGESDNGPVSSISQAAWRRTTHGRTNSLSDYKSDKRKATSKGLSASSSLPQNSKRNMDRDWNRRGTRVPPSTQPTSSNSDRPDLGRPPFSTQPSSASAVRPRPKPKGSNSSILTGFSPTKSSENITRLGTVELSSDEDEARPVVNRRGTGLNDGNVIDLTLDDDGNASPSTSTSSVQMGSPPRDASPKAAASIQPAQSPLGIISHGSPPAVRPKPRVSAVPKERMAPPKLQPAGSKPLNERRRRLSAIGREPEGDTVRGNDESTALGPNAEGVKRKEGSSTHQESAAATLPVLVPGISSISHQEELRFDAGATEVMETAYMDMDEPDPPSEREPSAGATTPLARIVMQTGNNESSPEQLEQSPEETTAPIERARELRSPSVAVQNKETQSQGEDANEVDLLLASSPLRTDAPELIHSSDATQLERPDNLHHPQTSTLVPPEKKSETLTDKLGMLDLSRPVATVGKDSCGNSDVSMSDLEKEDDIEPPSVHQAAPITQPHSVSIAGDLPGAAMREMNSDETDAKSRATTSMAIPSSSASTPSPEPAYSTPEVSGKPSSFTRAASPGALVVPPPTPGFMGFMGSAKKMVDLSPAKDKSPTGGVDADEKARSKLGEKPGEVKPMPNKAEVVRVGDEHLTGSVSEPIAAQAPAESPFDERKRLSTPPTTSDNGMLQPNDSLSPRSRARLRIPEVRPPRKPNMPALMPVSQSRIETEVGKDRSAAVASPSASMAPSGSDPPHKEPENVGAPTSPPSEAVASSRKLAKLFPGLLDSAISGTQKGVAPSSQKIATSSSPKTKSHSITFLRRQIERAEMRTSTASSSTRSNANEVSTSSGQSDSGGASLLDSPKKSKSSHSVLEQKDETPMSGSAVGVSVVRLSASSEEDSAMVGSRDSGVSEGSSEAPAHRMHRMDKVPNVKAAPKFYVARKTTPKRRPKVGIPSFAPFVRSVEKRKESKDSTSTSHFRKRILSNSSHSSSTSNSTNRMIERDGSASKRPRLTRSTDGEESSKASVSGLRRSSRQSRRSSGGSSQVDSDASTSSADPMDVINEPLDVDGESSSDQLVTPVTDLAGAVGDIAITPVPSVAKHYREIDRYFLNRDRGPTWYHVKDIPTELVNEVNATPEWCRDPVLFRQIFEAAIIQNTTEDEWESPRIQIINNLDDESTPPFEFYYTNRIYHGNGVPSPEYRNLKGCQCIGRCDPRSNTCACIIRQRKFFEQQDNNHQGFVYDDKGRVQIHEFPIFECNDACGCSEDCSNRVVQLGRKCHVNIVKTKNKGWGIFAGRKILSGTFIGIYSGEILLHEESLARQIIYNKIGRTYLFDIDFWYFAGSGGNKEVVAKYTMDAFHVGNFTRFMNHSCQPNCRINAVYINEANIEKPLLGVFSQQDINAGEELTFSYYGDLDEDDFKNLSGSEDQAYQVCLCGAPRCVGKLFSFSGSGE